MHRHLLVLWTSGTAECMPNFGSDECHWHQYFAYTFFILAGVVVLNIPSASYLRLLLMLSSALSSSENNQLDS
jgi:hypothetical protein